MTSTREPSPSLWPLSRSECLDLLATTTVGRVALMVDQRPQIFPVNYVLDGDTVLFRTAEGTILSHAGLSSVAFEVDRIDESHHTGWSVLVHGRADNITDAVDATSERLRQRSLTTWAPGRRDQWFAIRPQDITGRRLRDLSPEL
jgi:nitroimidazol reductase NimA-like FMN-containing flavoprotein (pyridoxamine 5'-phosphate oxidase superfamily)